nr:uncharacterized protein LOC105861111 isoform X3 [Microcebus murinus]
MDRRITVLCERSQQQKTNTSVDLDVGRGRDKYLKRRLVLELSSGQRSVTEKGDGETAVSRDLDSKDSAGEASEEGVSVVFQQDRGSRRSDHWTHANCCHYRCSLSRLSGIRQKSPPASPFFSSCPTGRLALMRTCLFLGVAEVKEKTPVFTVYLLVPFESRATALHCLPRKADKENRLLEKRLPPPASPSMGSVPLPPSPPPPQSTGPSTSSCWGERTRGPWRAPSPLSVSPSEMCPGSPVTGTGKGLAENGAAELLPQPLLVGPRRPKTQGHAGVGGGPHCETPMAPSRSLFPERWDGHLGRSTWCQKEWGPLLWGTAMQWDERTPTHTGEGDRFY